MDFNYDALDYNEILATIVEIAVLLAVGSKETALWLDLVIT